MKSNHQISALQQKGGVIGGRGGGGGIVGGIGGRGELDLPSIIDNSLDEVYTHTIHTLPPIRPKPHYTPLSPLSSIGITLTNSITIEKFGDGTE